MLFVIDVGNTNTVLGVYDGDRLLHHWRIQTHQGRTSDEHGILLRELFHFSGVDPSRIDDALISCVVPPMERALEGMVEDYFELDPMMIGRDIEPDMPILYANPREVGADRLVNAVAAYHRFETAMVVVDFGTATTFDALSEEGAYLGGAIAPGVTISSEALFQHASKLPRVDIDKPSSVVGQSTVDAIRSGLLYGYTGLVREIVARMKRQLGSPCHVIATGGLANLIAEETDVIDEVDELLTLTGLRLIYTAHRGASS